MIRLANWYFLLLIPIIIFIFLFLTGKRKSALKFSSVRLLMNSGMKKTVMHRSGKWLIVLSLMVSSLAMARPQKVDEATLSKQSGIDIAVVLDISLSMQSVDFNPNRLAIAKDTIEDFINKRPTDRISLIVFKATAHTLIPLTHDHNIVKQSLKQVNDDTVYEDGTAIGMAISVGLNRLKKSESKSRVIILITDGDNNAGAIDPETAAEMASELDIRIYTIGVGSDETIIPMGDEVITYEGILDEELLKRIAHSTSGEYYRAWDEKEMSGIFSSIDRLEKTEFEHGILVEYTEYAYLLIKIALILLLAGVFLDRMIFIRIP